MKAFASYKGYLSYMVVLAVVAGCAKQQPPPPVVITTPANIGGTVSSSSNGPSQRELEQLVSPIALYPDPLIGQILAASTHPTDIVEATRFVKDNPSLQGKALASAVDQKPWDPSVKALTQFPSVLSNMDRNLSWTSALGDAYYNNPQAVMNEIQALRRKAQAAGNLNNTSQQTVTESGQTIIIQPANPQVIYVPQYNPTVVYGAPVVVYPGYSSSDLFLAGAVEFTSGILIGSAIGGAWGCNWSSGNVTYNHYIYNSTTNNYYNHNWNNQNWNHENPTPNYNNWANNLKNQNWSQAQKDFNQNHPNFQQNYPNFKPDSQEAKSQYQQTHPTSGQQSTEPSSHQGWGQGKSGSQGNWGNDRYSGWGNHGSGNGAGNSSDRGGGGLFGGGFRPGGSAFGDSARGRWSSGGFGGHRR
ncbi:MAG TPA: DUF3300 domain-containing protein [Candidatus Binataceae bacterium]|nr:DUF3300 domain-containing protein [Candidatus Binataceae bacterium]